MNSPVEPPLVETPLAATLAEDYARLRAAFREAVAFENERGCTASRARACCGGVSRAAVVAEDCPERCVEDLASTPCQAYRTILPLYGHCDGHAQQSH